MHLEYSYFILCIVNAIGLINAEDGVEYLKSLCQKPLWTELKQLSSIIENGNNVTIEEIVNVDSVTSKTLIHKATQMLLLISCNSARIFVDYSYVAQRLKEQCEYLENKEEHKETLKEELRSMARLIENWQSALSKFSEITGVDLKNEVYIKSNILKNLGKNENADDVCINNDLIKLNSTMQSFKNKNCFEQLSVNVFVHTYQTSLTNSMKPSERIEQLNGFMLFIRYSLAAIYFKLGLQPTDDLKNEYEAYINHIYSRLCDLNK